MTPWSVWATGVLAGIKAPLDPTNADSLWAWSGAESLPRDRMSWNNPLNSTQPWPGAVAMNTIGTNRHVWAYASVSDGIDATCVTLLNGAYPVILGNLRGSVPRSKWQNACPNLGTWGTGCGWLQTNYGPVPDNLGGNMADLDRMNELIVGIAGHFELIREGGADLMIPKSFAATDAKIDGIGSVPPADLSAINAKLDALTVAVAKLTAHLGVGTP